MIQLMALASGLLGLLMLTTLAFLSMLLSL